MAASRFVYRHHRIPHFFDDATGWLSELLALNSAYQFDLIIPTTEDAVVPLQEIPEYMLAGAPVYRISDISYACVFNKHKSLEEAEACGIPTSPWLIAHNSEDLKCGQSQFGFPLVIKPLRSLDIGIAFRRQNVVIAFSEADLCAFGNNWTDGRPRIVQKFFRGRGVGIEILSKKGKILYALQHRRLHEPPLGGGSTYRITVPLERELIKYARSFVRDLGYTGVLMLEFKRDEVSGETKFIETNGRFWGSLPLAISSGADFPRFLFQMLVEKKLNFSDPYRTGLRGRSLVGDLMIFRLNLKSDARNPNLIYTSPWTFLKELKYLVAGLEREDCIALDDFAPFIVEWKQFFNQGIKRAVTAILRLVVLRSSAFRGGRPTLSPSGDRIDRVVMLCHGNTYRSPFAEQYLRAHKPEITVTSGALSGASNHLTPNMACDAAEALAIDLRNHRSKAVETTDLERADIIFLFDLETLYTALIKYPRFWGKMRFVGSFGEGDLFIPSPFGLDKAGFYKCFQRIGTCLDAFLTGQQ